MTRTHGRFAAVAPLAAALLVAIHPLTTAAQEPATSSPGVVSSSSSNGLPSGAAIVARHVEAVGGAAAHRSLQSIHARGRLDIPAQGIVATFELFTARPQRMVYRVNVPGVGVIENGYDGTTGWLVNPVAGPEVLRGRQLEEAAEDAWFDAPLHEPTRVRELTTLRQTSFDGRPAYAVRVVFHTGGELVEYYDVETGLLIGSEQARQTPQGVVPTVSVLRDYRRFGTLLQATTFVQRALGFEQIATVTSCTYDEVDASVFVPPPAIAALIRQ